MGWFLELYLQPDTLSSYLYMLGFLGVIVRVFLEVKLLYDKYQYYHRLSDSLLESHRQDLQDKFAETRRAREILGSQRKREEDQRQMFLSYQRIYTERNGSEELPPLIVEGLGLDACTSPAEPFDDDSCAIYYESYDLQSETDYDMRCIKINCCGHQFHLGCLQIWTSDTEQNNQRCPTCRRDIASVAAMPIPRYNETSNIILVARPVNDCG